MSKQFNSGFFIAMTDLVRSHGQPGIAADIIRSNGMDREKLGHMDEYDKVELRILNEFEGLQLRGLE